ncbi:unnamed protein product [Cylindrotheca closterium]|uniref:Uncharacterized protein n=1 Tax=Cylindrotheca closterium TaxID=2856 RepID=A0AAD2GA90_9STRA|nr:unnamed protein product [Cylindrotheca closterium]
MKFGNRFKKQQPLISDDIYLGGSDSINTERARVVPSPVGWDHQNDEGSPSKKGLHVLKKLNCGAAMNKDRYEDNHYPGFNPQHTYRPTYVTPPVVQESSSHRKEHTQQSALRKINKNRKDTSAAVRPVLITVNDGDLGEQEHTFNQPQQKLEFKSTFLVGPGGTTEDPMNRPPRNVTPEKEERKPKACVMTPRRLQGSDASFEGENANRNRLVPKSPHQHMASREMEDMEELQKNKARKTRWKRGMERSWKDDSDLVSASAFGEESTAFSSYLTYDESDYDSYTEGSLGSSQWTGYTGRSTKDNRGGRRSKSLSRRRARGGVFESVAEDLGVMASMLLSDGTSCISGAVDITRETIVSCKQN